MCLCVFLMSGRKENCICNVFADSHQVYVILLILKSGKLAPKENGLYLTCVFEEPE